MHIGIKLIPKTLLNITLHDINNRNKTDIKEQQDTPDTKNGKFYTILIYRVYII